jgi:hypothetical protein
MGGGLAKSITEVSSFGFSFSPAIIKLHGIIKEIFSE